MPYILQTENRKNLTSLELEDFCEKPSIDQVRCSPYQHQANRQVEQSVDTLKNMLRKDKK